MALNYVTLTCDLYDGQGSPLAQGTATFTPYALLTDTADHEIITQAPVVAVFSPQPATAVRKMLQMAAGPGGTGMKAQTVGYSVGGKSGTAHKQVGKGYASNKYRSWFTGMAPIDKPRIIVGVMVDEPSAGQYYGGTVAAPVFSEVVQQTLRMMGVQPDLSVKPQIVAKEVEESF